MRELLATRMSKRRIDSICADCIAGGVERMLTIYRFVYDSDIRVSYNALWVITHLPVSHREWLKRKRDELIDYLLSVSHVGLQRLLLTILRDLPVSKEDLRPDYLNFCLSKINSTDPYAIRALSLRQAYAQCRYYPELLAELQLHIDIMQCSEMSPGLASAYRDITRRIQRSISASAGRR